MEIFHLALRYTHITAGLLGLAAGTGAMIYPKGSTMHRQHGLVFFVSMMTMSLSGLYISLFINPIAANIMGGSMAFYLVSTAWLTAWRPAGQTGTLERGAALWGLAVTTVGLSFGFLGTRSPNGMFDHFPAVGYFVFGGIALLGTVLDVRVIARGGVSGAQRTTRHLWRMCLAFFMATGSFFFGQARLFPDEIRQSGYLAIPALAPLGLMVYFLVMVRVWPAIRRRRATELRSRPDSARIIVEP